VRAELTTSGNVTNYVGFDTEAIASSGDTLTNVFGLRVRAPTATGTITNAYGVFLEDQSAAGTSYGIYQVGSGDFNYFAGDCGIGTTTSQGSLSISDAYNTGTRSGVEVELAKTLTGTGALWRGVHVDPNVNAGTLTELDYFRCDSPSGAGTIGTVYGLLIGALKTGPAASATARALWQAGADDQNYLNGQTGVGGLPATDTQLYVSASYTGTIGTARYSIRAELDYSGSGTTLSDARVVETSLSVDTGETITNAYGFFAASPTGSGTMANAYGLYIETQQTGPATAGWGVYQNGTEDANRFNGTTVFNNGVTHNSELVMEGTDDDSYIRLNRLTTAQRNALNGSTPLQGMIIFNTTTGKFEGYDGAAWQALN
jgi:hypothetical protein